MKTLKATKDPTTATWAYASNLICHNLVFEMDRKRLDLRKAFPQLTTNIEEQNA